MPRTTIAASSILTPVGPFPILPVGALSLDLAWQAADVANLNQFSMGTGKYMLLARNVHASIGYTVTLTSAPDERRRTGDITAYALAFGKVMAYLLDQQAGWIQSDGMLYFAGSNASVQFCVIRIT